MSRQNIEQAQDARVTAAAIRRAYGERGEPVARAWELYAREREALNRAENHPRGSTPGAWAAFEAAWEDWHAAKAASDAAWGGVSAAAARGEGIGDGRRP